jgi:choloylglycine hydrolase
MVNVAAQMVTMIQATPYGTTLQPGADGNPQPRIGDWTIWWVVRDHTNRALYYASAFNTLLQKLDLMQLDFDRGPAFASIPVVPPPAGNVWYQPASFLGPPRDTRAAGECRRAPGPAHPVPDYWR